MLARSRGLPVASAGLIALAALTAALLVASPRAQGRPLQLEDLLQRENFGTVALAPGGRWLLVEQRGPYASGARFDYGDYNVTFRTRLMVADLTAGGPLRPLFPPTSGTGYQAGPIAPDGAHAVIYRLTPDRWQLGIATLNSGEVRWLDVTPDILPWDRSLQWLSATELLVIADAPDALPFELRARRPQAAIPALWAAQARGEATVTAVGSGRYIAARPRTPPRRLLRISATTGAVETLATGDWVDLDVSPSGGRVALVEAAEDVRLISGRPVQADYGLGVRRMRLRILDLQARSVTPICSECDVLTSPLSWSPSGDDLLAYVRKDGAPWSDGRLVRVRAETGMVATVDDSVRAMVTLRPERVGGGWWGADPLVFGTPKDGGRPDWYRVTASGPVKLTGELQHPSPRDLVMTAKGLLAVADGRLWRIDAEGHAEPLSDQLFAPFVAHSDFLLDRRPYTVSQDREIAGVLGDGAAAHAVRIEGDGRVVTDVPAPGRVVTLGETGAVVDRRRGGGDETLAWVRAGAPDVVLARINARFADLDIPEPIPVPHAGPNGERLTSWIFLPPRSAGAPPPPLVIVPYPGASHPAAPDLGNQATMDPSAILLGHGYAVLVPSLPAWRAGGGPSDGLADRVLAIVDASTRQAGLRGRFDPSRLGLWGHSFGGYGTVAMIGQTDRFSAAVAAAPATDLISDWGQAGPQRRGNPDEGLTTPWSAGWMESLQGDMRRPPWEDPDRYLRNSPLMQAGQVHTPLLLAYGEIDGSHPGQAEEMFSALFRQDKDAILLTYWGEEHLFASPGNLRDYYGRGLRFLDHYLRPFDEARGASTARRVGRARIGSD